MDIYQRYNAQRAAARNESDPIIDTIKDISSILIRSFGKGLNNAIDSYIITMIKTRDERRALLDLKDIDKATAALEKDIVDRVSKDMEMITKEISKRM